MMDKRQQDTRVETKRLPQELPVQSVGETARLPRASHGVASWVSGTQAGELNASDSRELAAAIGNQAAVELLSRGGGGDGNATLPKFTTTDSSDLCANEIRTGTPELIGPAEIRNAGLVQPPFSPSSLRGMADPPQIDNMFSTTGDLP